MTATTFITFSQATRRHPLVPAAAFLLAGIAISFRCDIAVPLCLGAAATALVFWAVAEGMLTGFRRAAVAHASLAGALLFAGIAAGQLNQRYVSAHHVVRFLAGDDPAPITARLRVVTVPDGKSHGNLYWIGTITGVLTQQQWVPATGDVRIKWRAGPLNPDLHRGDLVEVYGWLSRPEPALNPGAIDMRKFLAADRIFAQVRIPRAQGVVILQENPSAPKTQLLSAARLFLRSKLLEHTARVDVEASYAMVALFLGYRDPAIEDVSQSFADAGIAHLLAISGSHIVFFTALVWGLLRFVPMRPRWRELAVAIVVTAYVLATPCGPPVVRAAIALLMVLVSRLLGRPRIFLNILAAAAVIVFLLRPADILDAGAQLSFICTAALIMLSPRLHAALFARRLQREAIVADLAATRFARIRLRLLKIFCALITANLIGAGTALPLVAYHFGRINPYAVISGLLALPAVFITMAASALQLFLEILWPSAAAFAAPFSTGIALMMLWIVRHLAALPGSALALRAPPPWMVLLFFLAISLWAMRRWVHASRAMVINVFLACLVVAATWYAFTQPRGQLHVQTLSVGHGSCILLRLPDGQVWLLNAGSRDSADLLNRAVAPALRIQGVRHPDALFVSSFTPVAAQYAGIAIESLRPPLVLTSTPEWQQRGSTFAGFSTQAAIAKTHAHIIPLTARNSIGIGHGGRIQILWPMDASAPRRESALLLLFSYQNRRILFLDPANTIPLGLLTLNHADLRADAVVFLGPQRGTGDATLRQLLETTGAKTLIWSGRGPWAPRLPAPGEFNTADGFVDIAINPAGQCSVRSNPH